MAGDGAAVVGGASEEGREDGGGEVEGGCCGQRDHTGVGEGAGGEAAQGEDG